MTTIPAGGFSYDYQNSVRDLSNIYEQLKSKSPNLLYLIQTGPVAQNTKVEWLEDSLSPIATAITSFDTDGDGTGINVASTNGLRIGSILRFTSSADVTKTELVKVASVDSATDLTVVRDYGSSTGVTLVVGDKVFLVSNPQAEGTSPSASAGQEPDTNYNYTEILEDTAKVSRTTMQTNYYGLGVGQALNYEVANKMMNLMWQMNSSLIYGRRVKRTSIEKGTSGGLLQFMESGNIETTGGGISETILNNMIESIFSDGGVAGGLAIVCNSNQARKISAFNRSTNPLINVSQDSTRAGSYVSQFVSDLPVLGGAVSSIVVDQNFPKDQIAIINPAKVKTRFMKNFEDQNAANNGDDFAARRILGEFTFEIKDGKKAHALATGLTV